MPNENKLVIDLTTGECEVVEVSDAQQTDIMAGRADTSGHDAIVQEETDAAAGIDNLMAGNPLTSAQGAVMKKKLGLE